MALIRRLIGTTDVGPSTPQGQSRWQLFTRVCQIGKAVVDLISSIESRPVTLYISTSEISAW